MHRPGACRMWVLAVHAAQAPARYALEDWCGCRWRASAPILASRFGRCSSKPPMASGCLACSSSCPANEQPQDQSGAAAEVGEAGPWAAVVRLADRVGIIHAGRLVEELPGERLATAGRGRLVAAFRSPELTRRGAQALHARGIDAHVQQTSLTSMTPAAVGSPDQVATHLVEAGAPPMYLGVEHEDLEEHFLRITGGSGT